jgi:molecular chaperone GrpE
MAGHHTGDAMKEAMDREERDPGREAGEEREPGAVGVGDDAPAAGDEGENGEDQDPFAEVEELRDELGRVSERHLRLAAEFDNYRKRIERDRQTLVARLQADLVSSLLEVVDDLERVAETGETATPTAVVEGIRLVERKFLNILAAAGLEPIEAEGEPFDPSVMEAVATAPTVDPAEDHVVADVFQRGYRFGEVLVRPARVRVLSYAPPSGGSE